MKKLISLSLIVKIAFDQSQFLRKKKNLSCKSGFFLISPLNDLIELIKNLAIIYMANLFYRQSHNCIYLQLRNISIWMLPECLSSRLDYVPI